mgnify:CR=1 FL=1
MEIKNGIIIDGVLHEIASIREKHPCDNCSLQEKCDKIVLCTLIAGSSPILLYQLLYF